MGAMLFGHHHKLLLDGWKTPVEYVLFAAGRLWLRHIQVYMDSWPADSVNAYILLRVLFYYFGRAYHPLHCTLFTATASYQYGRDTAEYPTMANSCEYAILLDDELDLFALMLIPFVTLCAIV